MLTISSSFGASSNSSFSALLKSCTGLGGVLGSAMESVPSSTSTGSSVGFAGGVGHPRSSIGSESDASNVRESGVNLHRRSSLLEPVDAFKEAFSGVFADALEALSSSFSSFVFRSSGLANYLGAYNVDRAGIYAL